MLFPRDCLFKTPIELSQKGRILLNTTMYSVREPGAAMPKLLSSPVPPCGRLRISRRLNRVLPLLPGVDCSRSCLSCGWNRAEQARRLAQGHWCRGQDGLLRLVFPPKHNEYHP